jgi:hypothetical protein
MQEKITTVTQYINYFRMLAASHWLIQHDIASESMDAPEKSKCRFAIFEEDEVVAGLRSGIGAGPVLFLHPYFPKPSTNNAGDHRFNCKGAFIIAEKPANKNMSSKITTLGKMEQIATQIIMQLVFDANEGGATCPATYCLAGLTLNDFEPMEPLLNIFEGRVGYYVQFSFQLKQTKTLLNPSIYNEPTTWLAVGDPQVYPNTTP